MWIIEVWTGQVSIVETLEEAMAIAYQLSLECGLTARVYSEMAVDKKL